MKVALIGTGAAAYTALAAMHAARPGIDVDVFDVPATAPAARLANVDYRTWSDADFDEIHRTIRAQVGVKFPPPRTHFGSVVPVYRTAGGHSLWKSAEPGGLTRYWSAAMRPFTEADMDGWGLHRADLDPYYRVVADRIGLAGRPDTLDDYFGESFVNRPPMEATPLSLKLIAALSRAPSTAGFRTFSGIERALVDVDPNSPRGCVVCGGCFYGCFRDSIFHAASAMERERAALPHRLIAERVVRLRRTGGDTIVVTTAGEHTGYAKVFCGAGCIGSAALMLRSFGGLGDRAVVTDKAVFFFPIFDVGRRAKGDTTRYLAIANAVVGHLGKDAGARYSETLISPVPDYLLRFYLPGRLWTLTRWMADTLKARVLVGKLFIDGAYGRRYSIASKNDDLEFQVARDDQSRTAGRRALKDMAGVLLRHGFVLPFAPLMMTSTSSHYSGGFDPSAGPLAATLNGEVQPNVYLIDSSTFPVNPAQAISFTIMANAARIATEAVLG